VIPAEVAALAIPAEISALALPWQQKLLFHCRDRNVRQGSVFFLYHGTDQKNVKLTRWIIFFFW
jgi:hypothetical protein